MDKKQDIYILNNKAFYYNNDLLYKLINKVEDIANDLNDKQIPLIIKQKI